MQLVHCAIRFVDCLVDHALPVKPQRVESPPAAVKKVKHRPNSVPERFGLLDGEARAFHAITVYEYTSRSSSSNW